jgi:nicotinamidase-related amidase
VTHVDDDSEGVTGQALLVVDAINHFSHDDADALLGSYHRRVAGMEAGLARARSSRIPVVYANDANGRWDGDGPGHVRDAIERGRGGEVIARLAPAPGSSSCSSAGTPLSTTRLSARRWPISASGTSC